MGHSAGQSSSCKCHIYGARLSLQSALCHSQQFHCCTWTGQIGWSRLRKKHAEAFQRSPVLQVGKLATFLPVEAQEGRRHMALHKLLSFKHSHLFLQKTSSLLNSASCFILPYCHLPQNAFPLLQTFCSLKSWLCCCKIVMVYKPKASFWLLS